MNDADLLVRDATVLRGVSVQRVRTGEVWAAVSCMLAADALMAAEAAARHGVRIGAGVHTQQSSGNAKFSTAESFVASQRIALARHLNAEASAAFSLNLLDCTHLAGLRAPSSSDIAAVTRNLLAGQALADRRVTLKLRADKLMAMALALRRLGATADEAQTRYRSDLLSFELAALDAAENSGDQFLTSASVKLWLAQALLAESVGRVVLADAGDACEAVRRDLTMAMLGTAEPEWATSA